MQIRKTLSLIKISARLELMDRMSSAFAFGFIALGTVIKTGISLIFFKAIFAQVRVIGGWDYQHVLILQGVYFFIEGFAWATYIRGFNRLYRFIENGDLDVYLTKPVNLHLFFGYRYIDIFFSVPQLCIGIGLILYGAGINLQLLIHLPQFILLLVSAIIIHFSIIVILASINFWHIIPQTAYLFTEVMKLGQYPITIYQGAIRLILSVIVPLAFIYSFPAESLFSKSSPWILIGSPLLAIFFFQLSKFVWNKGLKQYESARG